MYSGYDGMGNRLLARYFLTSYQTSTGRLWNCAPNGVRERRVTQFELMTELAGFLILLAVLAGFAP